MAYSWSNVIIYVRKMLSKKKEIKKLKHCKSTKCSSKLAAYKVNKVPEARIMLRASIVTQES